MGFGDAPELFALLQDLAAQARTAAPKEVYLSALPTLGVTEREGWFGIGSRRVLNLGASYLHLLTRQELKAALAHEFGHYLGGDT